MTKVIVFIISFFLAVHPIFSQEAYQVVKGKIIDKDTEESLPFVNIIIQHTNPVVGAVSDIDGFFEFPKIPFGRINLEVSYVGYESVIIPEIVVSAAKEVYLEIALSPAATQLETVVVKPKTIKQKPLNNMATVSARMLSVEEANRYAGGFDDPARLAASFPGVASSTANNAIIIRGNAPKFLQWKMEGIEIPNPNHFANLGAFGGGGLTALSSNLLANSDFFTGAFPAEYNNALAGVFDIKMRTGNASRHEHSFEAGLIGLDLASEGPINKKTNSSYLVNYRYSTLGLMSFLLPEDAGGTNYQDLSFKLKFPIPNNTSLSFWGIGLIDNSGTQPELEPEKRVYYQDIEEQDVQQYMAAAGMHYRKLLKNNASLHSILAYSSEGIDLFTNRLGEAAILNPENRIMSTNHYLTFKTYLNKRFSDRHRNRTGVTLRRLGYDIQLDEADGNAGLLSIAQENGVATLNGIVFQFVF